MATIYSVNDWSAATTYNLYDIVKYNGKYFYSLKDGNLNNTPAVSDTSWGGYTIYNGFVKPEFVFKPNYNSPLQFTPRVKSIQYGDGYQQISPDGINNNLIVADLTFDLRTESETRAINHFLNTRQGTESFVFTLFSPFATTKLFVCPSWTANPNFFNNYSTRATFNEVVYL